MAEQVSLDQLKDRQIAVLNKIAYTDMPTKNWHAGDSLYKRVQAADPKLAKELKAAGLDHLVIKDYTNRNDKSGFCAIAYEDPKTGATGMSFRGTEGMDDLLHNPKDMADNTMTASIGVSPQSLEAIAFFEKNENKNGNNYLFGHSKGGELAAEVYVTNYNNVKEVHTINPQPINPYKLSPDQLAALQRDKFDAIVVNGDIVAWLGTTLYPVRYVKNNGSQEGFFGPHAVDAMLIDEDGNAVIERNPFSGYFGQGIAALLATKILGGVQRHLMLYSFTINLMVRVGNFLVNDLPDLVHKFVDHVKKAIDRFVEFTHEIKNALKEFVGEVVNSVSSWFKKHFNSGYKYASVHPYIKVDTYKLRSYAQRLESINRRLGQIDRRMDSLYTKVGFLDLWNLIQADLFTGESYKLRKCAAYLEETADNFETVERKIMSSL